MMDVKAYLRQYQPALKYAQRCFRDLDEARDISAKSPRLDGLPKGGGGGGLDEQVARIDRLERRAAAARDKALKMAENIEAMIDGLEDHRQKAVLRLKYIRGMTFDEIGTELFISRPTAIRIHGCALEKLRRQQWSEKSWF